MLTLSGRGGGLTGVAAVLPCSGVLDDDSGWLLRGPAWLLWCTTYLH